MAGLPVGRLVDRSSVDACFLEETIARTGTFELREGLTVTCGSSFAWWRMPGRLGQRLVRIVGVIPGTRSVAGRAVVVLAGEYEYVAEADELELWVIPRDRAALKRGTEWLRRNLGDPLR